jgi:hypothetical protein
VKTINDINFLENEKHVRQDKTTEKSLEGDSDKPRKFVVKEMGGK